MKDKSLVSDDIAIATCSDPLVYGQTGFSFTLFAEDDNSFSAMGNDRPKLTVANIKDTLPGTHRSHAQIVNEWFNTADFVPNAIGNYGDIGKNSTRGPGLFNRDMALLKTENVDEHVAYEFRTEFFNVFNNVKLWQSRCWIAG
jgi:hypothetical protein